MEETAIGTLPYCIPVNLVNLDVVKAESRRYEPVILSQSDVWRVAGKVLWWISAGALLLSFQNENATHS